MHNNTVKLDKIANLVYSQLKIDNTKVMQELKEVFAYNLIFDYSTFKSVSKKVKDIFSKYEIDLGLNKTMNLISKSLGYQNHHSLKVLIEKTIHIQDIENDFSKLKKLVILKDMLFKELGTSNYLVMDVPGQTHKFNILFTDKNFDSKKLSELLKPHGIETYKNTVPLYEVKNMHLQHCAFEVIKRYPEFFTPSFIENKDGSFELVHSSKSWAFYDKYKIQKTKDFILVDNYSADLYWNPIISLLDYIIKYSDYEAIANIEKMNSGTNIIYETSARNFNELKDIYLFKKGDLIRHFKSHSSFSEGLTELIYSTEILGHHKKSLLRAQYNGRTLKDVIIQYAVLKEKSDLSYDYLLELMQQDLFSDLENEEEYLDTKSAVNFLVEEIIYLAECYHTK